MDFSTGLTSPRHEIYVFIADHRRLFWEFPDNQIKHLRFDHMITENGNTPDLKHTRYRVDTGPPLEDAAVIGAEESHGRTDHRESVRLVGNRRGIFVWEIRGFP